MDGNAMTEKEFIKSGENEIAKQRKIALSTSWMVPTGYPHIPLRLTNEYGK